MTTAPVPSGHLARIVSHTIIQVPPPMPMMLPTPRVPTPCPCSCWCSRICSVAQAASPPPRGLQRPDPSPCQARLPMTSYPSADQQRGSVIRITTSAPHQPQPQGTPQLLLCPLHRWSLPGCFTGPGLAFSMLGAGYCATITACANVPCSAGVPYSHPHAPYP